MKAALTRVVLVAGILTVVAAGAGYGASGGSQTVTVAAGSRIDITVPAAASIGTTDPGTCGTTSTTINVKSNRDWNLQIRSEPITYPNGKPKDGSGTEMVNAFQYRGGSVTTFTNITSTYADLFAANQAKTGNRDVTVDYRQCVDWQDSPGTYTIVVEYLGVQF
jgi:hypothetical protein